MQDSPRLAQKRDTPEYKTGTATLLNSKEEVTAQVTADPPPTELLRGQERGFNN
jgi:hypothetical protein